MHLDLPRYVPGLPNLCQRSELVPSVEAKLLFVFVELDFLLQFLTASVYS